MATATKSARARHTLTDAACRTAKAVDRPRKLSDGGSLYLLVKPDGSKGWRFKFYHRGRERLMSLGTYPAVALAEARKRRDAARSVVEAGRDPVRERRAAKVALAGSTFRDVAADYLALREKDDTALTTMTKLRWYLEALKPLHNLSVLEIATPDVVRVCKAIEGDDTREKAHRAAAFASQVFRYAANAGVITDGRNPAATVRDVLVPVKSQSHAAVTEPKAVGRLLDAIRHYDGTPVVCYAMRLSAYLFPRPGELRAADWSEFDLAGATWIVPAARMKTKAPHTVPLPRQAVALLTELRAITGPAGYAFTGTQKAKPLSENAGTVALRRMGYSGDAMTWHGFRAMASTLLRERLGYENDIIEAQLSHQLENRVRAAYDRAEYLEQRRAMMQAYADYLDRLALEAQSWLQ